MIFKKGEVLTKMCIRDSRLAAGVGTGNDQQIKLAAEPYGDRNDLLGIQKRMASVLDMDASLLVEFRFAAPVMTGQGGFGKDEVQFGQDFQINGQHLCIGCKLVA